MKRSMHALDFDGQVDTCSLIYLALQSLLSRTTGLVIMDEGRANEHEPSLNLLGLRQPKHPFWPSDLSHMGPNDSEVGLVNSMMDSSQLCFWKWWTQSPLDPWILWWTFWTNRQSLNYAFEKMLDSELLGLFDTMMDILNQPPKFLDSLMKWWTFYEPMC